jgi:predicted nucleic acid-binding protein
MRYFDTSFLTPLFLREQTTPAIEGLVAELPTAELATSHWARVEFSSVLAREVRIGALDSETAQAIDARFEATIRQTFVLFLPTANDFDLATQYLAQHRTGLRGGDALHLAIASTRHAEIIYSLDKGLIKAGLMLGLPMSRGIPPAR